MDLTTWLGILAPHISKEVIDYLRKDGSKKDDVVIAVQLEVLKAIQEHHVQEIARLDQQRDKLTELHQAIISLKDSIRR